MALIRWERDAHLFLIGSIGLTHGMTRPIYPVFCNVELPGVAGPELDHHGVDGLRAQAAGDRDAVVADLDTRS